MTSSAPTSNLRCTWRDAWRQPYSQPLPLLSYLSPSPTCPSSSLKRYWSSEPPSACSCSSQCEQNFPFKLNFTKISFSTRSALMASHRMPLSYLTLLDIRLIQIQTTNTNINHSFDIRLIIDLVFVASCLLVVIISAVAFPHQKTFSSYC